MEKDMTKGMVPTEELRRPRQVQGGPGGLSGRKGNRKVLRGGGRYY